MKNLLDGKGEKKCVKRCQKEEENNGNRHRNRNKNRNRESREYFSAIVKT